MYSHREATHCFQTKEGGIDVFTDTAAIFNFIRFKEYYGMPRGHEHDLIYSLSIRTRAFWANFSLQWEKKIVVPCLDVIMNTFFPRNIQ